MKVKITRVDVGECNTKYGTKTRTMICTEQHGARMLSSFEREAIHLKEGDEVDIEVIEKGQYLNFKMNKTNIYDTIKDHEERIKALEDFILNKQIT